MAAEFRVRTRSGELLNVITKPEHTVRDLKTIIQQLKGFPIQLQTILFRAEVMPDNKHLKDVVMKDYDVFILHVSSSPTSAPISTVQQMPPAHIQPPPAQPMPQPQQTFNPLHAQLSPVNQQKLDDHHPYEAQVTQICEMGFTADVARRALKASSGNVERALEYIVSANIPDASTNDAIRDARELILRDPWQLERVIAHFEATDPNQGRLYRTYPERLLHALEIDPSTFDVSFLKRDDAPPPTPEPQDPVLQQILSLTKDLSLEQTYAVKRLIDKGYGTSDVIQYYQICNYNEQDTLALLQSVS